jgi:serine/threonine-protein kinase RsbW
VIFGRAGYHGFMSFLLFSGPCDAGAASLVRSALRDLADDPSIPSSVVDDLALAATELISNARNAGASSIDVLLSVPPPHLVLEVTDDAPGYPRPQDPKPLDSHGRGLRILGAISERWGVTQTSPEAKTVWAKFGG